MTDILSESQLRVLRAPARWLAEDVVERRARQAVARAQPVIEEGQRTIGRQRGQPQREPAELHRHGIDIHAVEAPLHDGTSEPDPFGVRDIARREPMD